MLPGTWDEWRRMIEEPDEYDPERFADASNRQQAKLVKGCLHEKLRDLSKHRPAGVASGALPVGGLAQGEGREVVQAFDLDSALICAPERARIAAARYSSQQPGID